jgi:hypothetical protein
MAGPCVVGLTLLEHLVALRSMEDHANPGMLSTRAAPCLDSLAMVPSVLLPWVVRPVETVLPETRVTTDTWGSFSREFDMYLA